MRYLCTKQLTVGGIIYYPGDILPNGAIIPERSRKLLKSSYISELNDAVGQNLTDEMEKLFTQEQVERMISEAVDEAVNNTVMRYTAKLEETVPGVYDGSIIINVKGENEQITGITVSAEEIQQVFSIMQLNADEGIKIITDVRSENVLILLHAADSRKTIKNAAKEQADKLFRDEEVPNECGKDSETIETTMEGSDI